jgi:hypothetical protein
MAVNLGSDGKRVSQETAEQRQNRLQNVRERAKKSGREIRAKRKMAEGRERKRSEKTISRNI